MTEGRSMLLEAGHQSGVSTASVFVMGTDYSREMRVDRVTPKKHRKAVHARRRDRRWSMYITGARMRLQVMGEDLTEV